jgi:hypothetical protein
MTAGYKNPDKTVLADLPLGYGCQHSSHADFYHCVHGLTFNRLLSVIAIIKRSRKFVKEINKR